MLKYIIGLLLVIISLNSSARTYNYEIFDNYKLSAGANSIRFFLQDSLGMMWIGTDKGLFSFDGYTTYPHFNTGEKTNSIVYTGIFINDEELLLGYETGLLVYNIKEDNYQSILTDFKHEVRSLLKIDNEIWIGCSDGLFIYDLNTGAIKELFAKPDEGIKHRMIYAMVADAGYVYLGSNRKIGRYSLNNKEYQEINTSGLKGDFFVHSLLMDDIENCIWIGKGRSLLKYYPDSESLEYVNDLDIVKSMAFDSENNLVMGTDNGLCLYNKSDWKYVVHDSRESKSLANNVVWCVFKDNDENIWLGTDNGISLMPEYRRFNYIPIYDITGTGEGNLFSTIYIDSFDTFWLGGSNGLIKTKKIIDDGHQIRWFKMGGSPYQISHNHIRDIFEDDDRNLWIATDYGINRFNRQTQQFTRYSIYSPDGKQNGNWAYDILEDRFDRLWVASFNGGIFVIDKKRLMSNENTQVADVHYSTSNGLSGNNVDFLVFDKKQDIWALIHNTAIDVIDGTTGEVTNFPIQDYTDGIIPNYLMSDKKGFIWVGYTNGVARIDPVSKIVETISLRGTGNTEVLEMVELENSVWVSTSNGISIIDKKEMTSLPLSHMNQVFSGMHFDEKRNQIVLGGVDALALSDLRGTVFEGGSNLIVSALWVNDQIFVNKKNPLSIRYKDHVMLDHNQNNIEIKVSDLNFTEENKSIFTYKINDDKSWTTIPAGENSIRLNELSPGTYNVSVSKITNEDAGSIKSIAIVISPPWYGSPLAKLIYFIMFLSLIWWVYFFIRAKNRMKFEHLEKEKTLEQTKLKINFFSDVAHEFKTPLSLVIAPLKQLIMGTKNEKDRYALEMISQNAEKLNALIHQAIDYYRDDSKVNVGLILSKVELVEFAQSIFTVHKDSLKDRGIDFIFDTNVSKLVINIDTLKIESVLNNLLSNAGKFTSTGDSIILSINYNPTAEEVEIRVTDTGSGISENDIPYVFERFFQSSDRSKEGDGTGIGLFLVKNYIELHGGHATVSSIPNEGTTLSVRLPVIIPETEETKEIEEESFENEEKQVIVIVEDNLPIAEFIYNTFNSEYKCVIAHNGKTGLKVCQDLKPDIIIADIMMPVMDGIEMVRQLKKSPLTSTIPVVFLTAKDDKNTELKSIELNIEAFITKPFDSTILNSRIKQILTNRKLLVQKARIEQISSPKKEQVESQDEKFLISITKIIEDNISNPDLNVNMVCELAEVSPKHLYRKVKQVTGMASIEYIRSIRLKKAAMYLSNKNFTISEVMFMVGFSNHSYFAKCFQARFGRTPRQYCDQQKREFEK